MKNLVVLGAVALLLFSLSAALSLWLNQSKKEAEAEKIEKPDTKVVKPTLPAVEPSKEQPKDTKTIPPIVPPTIGPEAGVLDQQARLERKALQISMVLADVQSQREATDALLKQVTAALQNQPKTTAPDQNEQRLQKEREDALKNERLNLIKLAAIYDAMTPEGAAPNIKSMAEAGPGRLEQVAQLLMLMKERNAARLMEALNDPAMVAQLMDKMRQIRNQGTAIAPPPAVPPSPTPAFGSAGVPSAPGAVRPAGGP